MDVQRFLKIGEPFLAGFFESPERSRFYRFARANRRFREEVALPPYTGGLLYPEGPKFGGQDYAAVPDYSFTFSLDDRLLEARVSEADVRDQVRQDLCRIQYPPTPHTVGGYTYTHSLPNYLRIEHEGLDSYEDRILRLPASDFRDGLLEVVAGIRAYRDRILEKLIAEHAPEVLTDALRQVPFRPARNLYEAFVARNFIFYVDGCDNPGCLDADWADLYRGENAEDLYAAFFKNVDDNGGWSSSVGPDYSPLTVQALHAVGGRRRPQIELRVTPDMPDEVWDAALAAVKTGCGHPSFYNEPLYQAGFRAAFPEAPAEDLLRFNGGGCTESMFEGITRAGSLDAGINTALVLAETLRDALPSCPDFDSFYRAYLETLQRAVDGTLEIVDDVYRQRAEFSPHPVRTLLIDDCIDKATDYNAGGARMNYGVVNFAGLINAADSLLAVRHLVYEKKAYSPEAFLTLLAAGDGAFRAALSDCPHYGADDPAADALAADLVGRAFAMLRGKKPFFGTCYLPSSIQFVTYTDAGLGVPATPDGREAGAPLCDSLGPLEGKDVQGPTAMLNSVARLPLADAVGTPVVNFRIRKGHVDGALKPLIRTFFRQGGMQLQVNCVSREDMEDALIHPEKHTSLIVRTGGYSEYFNSLSHEMKLTLLARREF